MSLDFEKRYVVAAGFERLDKDNKTLMVNYDSAVWLRTNETGGKILEKLDGNRSLAEIIAQKAQKDEYNVELVTEIVTPFLEQCEEMGIIQDVENKGDEIITPQEKQAKRYPNDIWIHVSNICNLACPFCYSSSGPQVEKSIDIRNTLDFLQGVPKDKRKGIIISGGEPFLFEKLGTLAKELKDMGFTHVLVITNGTVGSEYYANVLPYVDTLQVSVDGTVAEVHDITRGKGSFAKLCSNIEKAKKLANTSIICSFTPTKYNILDLPNLPTFAVNHGIEAIHVTRLIPAGRGKDSINELIPDKDNYKRSLEQFFEEVKKINYMVYYSRKVDDLFKEEREKQKYLKITFAADQSRKIVNGGRRISCGLGSLISIGYDSKIYPCPSLTEPEFVMGDLADGVDKILNNVDDFVERYSVEKCNDECAKCKLKYFCGGGCRACSYGMGDIHMLDPNCNYYKESLMETLWNYDSQTNSK